MRDRKRLLVRGTVQGVGFRPHVYRLARSLGLSGWVRNTPLGVVAEVEGPADSVEEFGRRVVGEAPAVAHVESVESHAVPPEGSGEFIILESGGGEAETSVPPDLATCPDCLRELFDPSDRRSGYPFINCTACGPRYSIILSLPYDRPNTTMRGFEMCGACSAEYNDPSDRRFHAQPNACPECGPGLLLMDPGGLPLAGGEVALEEACRSVGEGRILALMGLGGFHLVVRASDEGAVAELRRRKRRPTKPFAIMAEARLVDGLCEVSAEERALLESRQAPIVLMRAVRGAAVSRLVAPGNPFLGVMLPYTPLHHLLAARLGEPVVATSGNLSEEPVCYDPREALGRLSGIADLFLVHDRPIARHVDDSVAAVFAGRPVVLRRARGYAPRPVRIPGGARLIAFGAMLKNTVTVAVGDNAVVSQHIGDLDSALSLETAADVARSLEEMYPGPFAAAACDMHPDSPRLVLPGMPRETVRVQHHAAHVLSCMADNGLSGPVLGVAWDGTGFGPDGTVWGGEFLSVDPAWSVCRTAHLRLFPLPGGDKAAVEPRRSAAGLIGTLRGRDPFEAFPRLAEAFEPASREAVSGLLRTGVNCPLTSSAGRLFDAVSALLGICLVNEYEGHAAMSLEYASMGETPFPLPPPVPAAAGTPFVLDWGPTIEGILAGLEDGAGAGPLAAGFHEALACGIREVALRAGIRTVVLTGGCFQNRYLTESAIARLRESGFDPRIHRSVPPGDGGISLGQAVAARTGRSGDVPRGAG